MISTVSGPHNQKNVVWAQAGQNGTDGWLHQGVERKTPSIARQRSKEKGTRRDYHRGVKQASVAAERAGTSA